MNVCYKTGTLEIIHASGITLAEAGFITASGLWTYFVFAFGGETIFALATAIGSPIIGLAVPAIVDVLNPVKQTQQALVLRNKIIEDQDVEVKNIDSVIDRLDLVLSKIE